MLVHLIVFQPMEFTLFYETLILYDFIVCFRYLFVLLGCWFVCIDGFVNLSLAGSFFGVGGLFGLISYCGWVFNLFGKSYLIMEMWIESKLFCLSFAGINAMFFLNLWTRTIWKCVFVWYCRLSICPRGNLCK